MASTKRKKIKWLLLFGAAGSGKGSQAAKIKLALEARGQKVAVLATGSIFRNPPDTIDMAALALISSSMKKGDLVPDEITLSIAGEAMYTILASGIPDWIILDGIPRNSYQLAALMFMMTALGLEKFFTFELVVAEKELTHRLAGRKTCKACGEIHSAEVALDAACSKCGEHQLFIRDDDKDIASVKRRLQVYKKETSLVLQAIRVLTSTLNWADRIHVHTVNGELPIEAVTERLLSHLELAAVSA